MATTEQSLQLQRYSPEIQIISNTSDNTPKQQLYDILSHLGASSSTNALIRESLDQLSSSPYGSSSVLALDDDGERLSFFVWMKVVASTYANTIDTLLNEALDAEAESQWWGRIERKQLRTAYFLLQTSPLRAIRLAGEVSRRIRSQNIPLAFSSINRETLTHLISPAHVFASLFPISPRYPHISSPLQLTRQECRAQKHRLEKIRDQRAEELGSLTLLGRQLNDVLVSSDTSIIARQKAIAISERIVEHLRVIITNGEVKIDNGSKEIALQQFYDVHLPMHLKSHDLALVSLRRPARLTLLWPRLFLLPPVILFGLRSAYRNRDSIYANLKEATETVSAFWSQWVIEPVKDILNTVRTGGDEGGRVISKEGLKSDMDSLERMVFALATEKRAYTPAQLEDLSRDIRQGDLTTILRVYEDDIKSPLKSAVGGTLFRSLLIQVQKTKVDVDLALSGIDKLLRSQELTFGFVGVSPSLVVLYVFGGWVRGIWSSGKGNGRFGGKQGRENSFFAIRRIERLLNSASPSESPTLSKPAIDISALTNPISHPPLDPLTQGLLLVSLTYLRRYADTKLPKHSQLREGFVEDLADLEDVSLGREEKLRVVGRMWRSWGAKLGWGVTPDRA